MGLLLAGCQPPADKPLGAREAELRELLAEPASQLVFPGAVARSHYSREREGFQFVAQPNPARDARYWGADAGLSDVLSFYDTSLRGLSWQPDNYIQGLGIREWSWCKPGMHFILSFKDSETSFATTWSAALTGSRVSCTQQPTPTGWTPVSSPAPRR